MVLHQACKWHAVPTRRLGSRPWFQLDARALQAEVQNLWLQLTDFLRFVKKDGWPRVPGTVLQEDERRQKQSACVLWLSWAVRLGVMRDIMRAVNKAHKGFPMHGTTHRRIRSAGP